MLTCAITDFFQNIRWNIIFCSKSSYSRLLTITIKWIWTGQSWPWSYGSWIYNYLCNQCLSPLMLWVRISTRARCTTPCDKVCQWLVTGRWFSPVSSINKTDRHEITEILLKVTLSTIKQTNKQWTVMHFCSLTFDNPLIIPASWFETKIIR
jgi:hypothetical protein